MDELSPIYGYPAREICTMKDAQCNGRGCYECGFGIMEAKRRKRLPLVKLDNGLYGKIIRRKPNREN